MKKFSMFALLGLSLCLLAGPLYAQNRVIKLENDMSTMLARLTVIESKLDRLTVPDPFATSAAVQSKKMTPACPGCTCGCQVTGDCTCSTMPAQQVKAAPVRYKSVCSNGVCRLVQLTSEECAVLDGTVAGGTFTTYSGPNAGTVYYSAENDGSSGTAQRTGPFRRILHFIFKGRGGSGGCASCGG